MGYLYSSAQWFKKSIRDGDRHRGVPADAGVAPFLRVQNAHSSTTVTGIFVLVGALFGLTLGSFLNVVVYRSPRYLSVVRPGSFCPLCKAALTSGDNVPVLAWIWLRGRCRHCQEPISIRYPLVEAGTAAVFVALVGVIRPLWGLPGWWAFAATMLVAALIENDGQACPPAVTVIGGAVGLLAFVVGAAVVGHLEAILRTAIGLGAGMALATALGASSRMRGRLGLANIVLIPAWGACLAWLGTASALIGAAVAAGLLATTMVVHRDGSEARSGFRLDPLAICLILGLVAGVLVASLNS